MTEVSVRLSNILVRLFNEEIINKHDLAQEFGVSAKTIQRDINEKLNMLPIIKNRKGDYYLSASYIKKNNENLKKLIKIFDIKTIPNNLSENTLNKLLESNTSPFIMNNSIEIDDIGDKYELSTRAILEKRELKCIYNGKQRILKPYKLANYDDIWYLIAHEGRIKNFTLYKLKNLRLGDEFCPDSKLLRDIENSEVSFITANKIDVVLELDSFAKGYFLERKILKNQKIIDNKIDSLIIQTTVNYDEEIIRIVLKWIPHIKILSPKNIAKDYKKLLKDYIKKL